MDFEGLVSSLNEQGFLLKKGAKLYQLQTDWTLQLLQHSAKCLHQRTQEDHTIRVSLVNSQLFWHHIVTQEHQFTLMDYPRCPWSTVALQSIFYYYYYILGVVYQTSSNLYTHSL